MEQWIIFNKRRQNGLKTSKQEKDELLKFILTNRYFNTWKNDRPPEMGLSTSLINDSKLEIYLTSSCNQKCEYCYLVKHGSEIYPQEFNTKENILNNLEILFNWIIKEDFFIPEIEYFTGEIWHNQFGLDVLELTYQAILKGLQVKQVLIPSNCSFLLDEIQTQKIQRYINKIRSCGVNLQFSISVDGAIIEDFSRPLNNNQKKTDEFYDRMFLFAVHNEYYFHPMLSSSNIKYWKENYKWWDMMCKKYNFYSAKQVVMMLEVRNDDWTDESIKDYCDFLDFLIEEEFKDLNYNVKEFAQAILNPDDYQLCGYLTYGLPPADTFAGCTVANSLCIRVGDLAICPCHRTAYPKFLYGHFIVKDNQIIDLEAENVNMAIRILLANNNLCHFKCDTCPCSYFCLKGCFGSQIESTGDPFMPIPSVCHLFEEKLKFLITKYRNMGVIDEWKTITPYAPTYWQTNELISHIERIENAYGLGEQ